MRGGGQLAEQGQLASWGGWSVQNSLATLGPIGGRLGSLAY
jgi:hypothetical protein